MPASKGAAGGEAACDRHSSVLAAEAQLAPGQAAGREVAGADGARVEHPDVAHSARGQQGDDLRPDPACSVDADPCASPRLERGEAAVGARGRQVEGVDVGLQPVALRQGQPAQRHVTG
ncbi:hypothetical protein HTZ77_27555 [Nonomuraea sp. SMC257]|uniref:Uncharacterized protein n=1 Tax=Nonomuraea montanisoli TaxID=2741721 RepID=A0A7Y6IBG0_9ACTN|nr:hypothetical protein [Nonomuraea montanisoli]